MSAIDWVLLSKSSVEVGDLVSADAGGMPVYRVVALQDGAAVVQGDVSDTQQTLPLDRFNWKVANAH